MLGADACKSHARTSMALELRMVRTVVMLVLVCAWKTSPACSCVPTPSVDEALRSSEVVLDGTVVAVEDRQVGLRRAKVWLQEFFGYFYNNPADVGFSVRFKTHEVWKGPERSEVVLFTHKSTATCGYPVRVGERYLVYAYELEGGAYELSLCSRTRERTTGEEDAVALRSLSKSKKF
jgi:hypothetical protein